MSKEIRVLHVVNSWYPFRCGGAERQAFLLSETIANIGNKSDILCYCKKYFPQVIQFPQYKIFKIIKIFDRTLLGVSSSKIILKNKTIKLRIKILLKYMLLILQTFLFYLIISHKYNIIHIHSITPQTYVNLLFAKFFRKKIVFKDSTLSGIKVLNGLPKFRFIKKNIVNFPNSFVAITSAIENDFKSINIERSKIVIIPNGVVLPKQKTNIKKEKIILFVGNIYQEPAKGVDTLLRAWSLVNSTEWQVIILGDGLEKKYLEFIEEKSLKNITFLGHQDVMKYYSRSKIYISCSRREGLSNSLLEAMSYGLLPIVTNIPGNTEVITNEYNGLVYKVDDYNHLAEILKTICSDYQYYQHLIDNAVDTIKKKYDIYNVAHNHIENYKNILTKI